MSKPQYRWKHQQERARWLPVVDAGEAECCEVICLKPSRHIEPGDPWDLAHAEDGLSYRGPAHPLCNRSEGALRRARLQTQQDQPAWMKRGRHDCPVCGVRVKWAESRTCSRRCASVWRSTHPADPNPKPPRDECKHGHSMADAYAYPDGRQECRTCKRDSAKAWKEAHPEAVRTHRAKWRAVNA